MELAEYPKIRDLPKVPELFAFREVVATEKIHGMNWRIGVPDSAKDPTELVLGSRSAEAGEEGAAIGRFVKFTTEELPVQKIIDTVASYRGHKVLYGEICGPGIQKGVKYRAEGIEFRLFDVFVGGKYYLTMDELEAVAKRAGLKVAPVVYKGPPTLESLDALLNLPSKVGIENGISPEGNLAEGIVVRADPPFYNRWGDLVVAKHKPEAWQERNPRPPKPPGADADQLAKAEHFVETFVVNVRLSKMVDKLKERGEHTGTVKDIGALVRLAADDLRAEESEAFAAINESALSKYLGKKVAALYKEMLGKDP